MSQIHSEAVLCPACGHERMVTLFRSLNAERVPGQILRILDGNFEQLVCPACQHVFRPQHQLLYSHFSLRIWIVMYPPEARMTFLSLEEGLMPVFAAQFAAAPNIIRTALRGILSMSLVSKGNSPLPEQV